VYPEPEIPYSLQPGYHAISVNPAGTETLPWSKTVYAMRGETTYVCPSFESVQPPYTPSEEPAPQPSIGKIMFGATCVGTRIYVDGVEVWPELNVEYELTLGYHSIVISKTGYNDWYKTVYIAQGDTLTVSPYLEPKEPVETPSDGTTPTPEGRRVYLNTEPDGAKILVNGQWSGQWTPGYVDLAPGCYELCASKTGYEIQCTIIHVTPEHVTSGDLAVSECQTLGLM
jgi:hypothetical protein